MSGDRNMHRTIETECMQRSLKINSSGDFDSFPSKRESQTIAVKDLIQQKVNQESRKDLGLFKLTTK